MNMFNVSLYQGPALISSIHAPFLTSSAHDQTQLRLIIKEPTQTNTLLVSSSSSCRFAALAEFVSISSMAKLVEFIIDTETYTSLTFPVVFYNYYIRKNNQDWAPSSVGFWIRQTCIRHFINIKCTMHYHSRIS